jgi:hypothetical protein
MLAAGLVYAAACGGDHPPPEGASEGESLRPAAASCVETYSPQTLRHRAFAFDGTPVSVEDRRDPRLPAGQDHVPWVTFRVNVGTSEATARA